MTRELGIQRLSEFFIVVSLLPPIYSDLGSREAHNLEMLKGAAKKKKKAPRKACSL